MMNNTVLQAISLLQQDRLQEARLFLTESVASNPLDIEVRKLLAMISYHLGDYKTAISQFRALTEMQPGNSEFIYGLGSALADSDTQDEARKMLEKSIELDRQHSEFLTELYASDVIEQPISVSKSPMLLKRIGKGIAYVLAAVTLLILSPLAIILMWTKTNWHIGGKIVIVATWMLLCIACGITYSYYATRVSVSMKSAQCAKNAQQLGTAMSIYMQDYNGKLPDGIDMNSLLSPTNTGNVFVNDHTIFCSKSAGTPNL